MTRGTRRYRFVNGEERPVWASARRLEQMGREWGLDAARKGHPLGSTGNTTHDEAARLAYDAERRRLGIAD